MVLCDPMVDPRGGAFTLGLGLIEQLAVVPHHDQWTHDRSRRTFELAGAQFPVVVVDKQTAIIRSTRRRMAHRRSREGADHVRTASRSGWTPCREVQAP